MALQLVFGFKPDSSEDLGTTAELALINYQPGWQDWVWLSMRLRFLARLVRQKTGSTVELAKKVGLTLGH